MRTRFGSGRRTSRRSTLLAAIAVLLGAFSVAPGAVLGALDEVPASLRLFTAPFRSRPADATAPVKLTALAPPRLPAERLAVHRPSGPGAVRRPDRWPRGESLLVQLAALGQLR